MMMRLAFKDENDGYYEVEVDPDSPLPCWAKAMTPVELRSPASLAPPQVVTMRQARLALHAAGILAAVEAAVQQAGATAQIEWEYAQELRRDHPLIPSLTQAIGLTEAQLDALFAEAAAL